jgi:hypothetical protein
VSSLPEGVNFLGFHIRQFKGRCYTFPQKEKVLSFLAGIRAWLRANISVKPEAVILTSTPGYAVGATTIDMVRANGSSNTSIIRSFTCSGDGL